MHTLHCENYPTRTNCTFRAHTRPHACSTADRRLGPEGQLQSDACCRPDGSDRCLHASRLCGVHWCVQQSGINNLCMAGQGVTPVHLRQTIQGVYRSGWLASETLITTTSVQVARARAMGGGIWQLFCRPTMKWGGGVMMCASELQAGSSSCIKHVHLGRTTYQSATDKKNPLIDEHNDHRGARSNHHPSCYLVITLMLCGNSTQT